jgi:mono/diheme cytochrome c family protein
MRLLGIFLGIGILFVALVATASAEPLADAAAGKATWEKSLCARCHGANGEGKFAGPRAGDTRTAAQWITQVRTPRANMPMFTEKQYSDSDITDMNEYMKTLPAVSGFTPPASTAKPGDPPGKALIFQKRCIACHGENGPVGYFTSTDRIPTTDAVIKQLRTPKNHMPTFSDKQVSESEAAQIADFLAAEAKAAPAPLPKSGDPVSLGLIAALGAAVLAGGLAIRRFV